MKQADFARAMKVTPTTAWKWESGRRPPHLRTLVKIAKKLGKSLDWLLGIEGKEAA